MTNSTTPVDTTGELGMLTKESHIFSIDDEKSAPSPNISAIEPPTLINAMFIERLEIMDDPNPTQQLLRTPGSGMHRKMVDLQNNNKEQRIYC